jgi:hypothetical protein
MFIVKYTKSIFSFGLSFLFLISGIVLKFFLNDIIALESDNLDNLMDQETSSDKTLLGKVKSLP